MEEEKHLPTQSEQTKKLNFVNTAFNTFEIDPNPTNNVSKQVLDLNLNFLSYRWKDLCTLEHSRLPW